MFCSICTKHFFAIGDTQTFLRTFMNKRIKGAHGRGGGYNIGPPSQIFNKLVNKNAIKLKIEDPLLDTNTVKSIDLISPPGILVQT
jgi:hypothetical protein